MELVITFLSDTLAGIAGLKTTFSPWVVGRGCGGGCRGECLEAPPVLINSEPLLYFEAADADFAYISCSPWTFGIKFVLLFGTSYTCNGFSTAAFAIANKDWETA